VIVVWFALAAAGAGLVRHGVNLLGRAWLGTLVVNLVGSFVLGYVLGSGPSDDVGLVVGTAACGSLTTFSTFALETVEARDGTRIRIVLATVIGTVAAATVGHWLA
jgi:fluoride exporter